MIKRPDLSNAEIARKWISGSTIEELSVIFSCSRATISKRLKKARREFPALDWDSVSRRRISEA